MLNTSTYSCKVVCTVSARVDDLSVSVYVVGLQQIFNLCQLILLAVVVIHISFWSPFKEPMVSVCICSEDRPDWICITELNTCPVKNMLGPESARKKSIHTNVNLREQLLEL